MAGTSHQLSNGTRLNCSLGSIRVLDFLGEGGQGEVYRVEANGNEYALKYYFSNLCTQAFKNNLEYIVENPVESPSFAWPIALVENGDQFGYIMPLLPKQFKDISEWIGGCFSTSLDTLIKACVNLCDAFRNLHATGYSYKDISNSNVLFDPGSGDVLIVDNDNVTPNSKSSGIIGTNGFMAPELVSGDERIPSRLTDLYSLSVLLFEILVGEHPLNGKREYNMSTVDYEDDELLKLLYGPDTACFIFKDPHDLNRYIETSAEAQVQAKEMWMMYPDFIQGLFSKCFVDGIKNPHKRPQAFEWTEAFLKLLGMLYSCPDCGMRYIYDRTLFYQSQGAPECDKCGSRMHIARIKIGDNVIMLSDDTNLYSGYFNVNARKKLIPILHFEKSNGQMTFTNQTSINVVHKNRTISQGDRSLPVDEHDQIIIHGVSYPVAQ